MKTLIYVLLTVSVILLISTLVMGQGGNPPALPFMNDADQAPIDGGLSLLAAAGGGYAIKKLRDRRKNRDSDL